MGAAMQDDLGIRRIIPGAEIEEEQEVKDQIRMPAFLQAAMGTGMEAGPALRDAAFSGQPQSDYVPQTMPESNRPPPSTPRPPAVRTETSEFDIVRVQEQVPAAVAHAVAQAGQFDPSENVKSTPGMTLDNTANVETTPPPTPELDPALVQQLLQQAASAQEEQAEALLQQQVDAQLSRLKGAVELLRSTSQALAEQARADAVEIGFEVARHLLQQEVSQSVSSVMAFAKQAMAQVGQARRVVVRLHPDDVERVREQGLVSEMEALCTAQVEVQAEPSLAVGDVELDTDLGCVDGRLETRLRAMYQALQG